MPRTIAQAYWIWRGKLAKAGVEAARARGVHVGRPARRVIVGRLVCSRCSARRPVEEFPRDRQRPCGRLPYCRRCASDRWLRNAARATRMALDAAPRLAREAVRDQPFLPGPDGNIAWDG